MFCKMINRWIILTCRAYVMRQIFFRGNVTHLFDLEEAVRALSSTDVAVYAQHVFMFSRLCARICAPFNGHEHAAHWMCDTFVQHRR